jgi:hypothetical protein
MNSSRGEFYSIFKKEFGLEKYLLRLPSHYSVWITKLRTSNLKLPIEVGRWYGIPKEKRYKWLLNLCSFETSLFQKPTKNKMKIYLF